MKFRNHAATVGILACITHGTAWAQGTAAPAAPAPAAPAPAAAAPAAAAAPLPPIEKAVLAAANDLFSKAQLPADAGDKILLVIDPLIDGVTGIQTVEGGRTRNRIINLVRSQYPRFDLQRFNADAVAKKPVVMIGTLTPINNAGQARGPRDAYRVCLALADLKSGKLISKGFAKASPKGVDPTPVAFFRDSPTWTKDPATVSLITSCQGTKTGDPIKPMYVERIQAAAYLSDAIRAYDSGDYKGALDLYTKAAATPGGDQLRVYDGLYLTNLKLKRNKEAAEAFSKLVAFGMKNESLAVKYLFGVNSTKFAANNARYAEWTKSIAEQAAKSNSCLDLIGHASPTGSEAHNDQLSAKRAEVIKQQLVNAGLNTKLTSKGVGFRENLIGTGRDDASDALDRRVEFKVTKCS
jgi:outer membrane protein OmpA-like peptidoglycan-associated protein